MIKKTPGYQAIAKFYGTRTAERSKVPLINHIDEGIKILELIGSDEVVMEAFAVHPLFQHDDDLRENFYLCDELHPLITLYAMEYRSTANAFLSDKIAYGPDAWGRSEYYVMGQIKLPVLPAVKEMLIADKVQNRKDFEIYHKGTHPRSEALDFYFKRWLKLLDVTEEKYQELISTFELVQNADL